MLLLLLLIPSVLSAFSCPGGGLFRNPDKCDKYIHCVRKGGRGQNKSCPPGLLFNAEATTCDWPANVNCDSAPVPAPTDAPNPAPTRAPAPNPTRAPRPRPTRAPVVHNCTNGPSDKKVVCYYINWAYYRKGAGKYTVANIDPHLCTHVIYSFAILDGKKYVMKAHDTWLDLDSGLGNIKKFLELREANPKLRLLIALGGWNDSRTKKYSVMLASKEKIANFISEAVKFIKKYGFDGLDLDYEYPNYDGVTTDRKGFTQLVKGLRKAFDPYGWELTAAVGAAKNTVEKGYDVAKIAKHLDFINLMTYDLHGSWEKQADHQAPLYERKFEPGSLLTVDYAVKLWLRLGTPRSKLMVGIPTYGRSFTLAGSKTAPPAPSRDGGKAGPITRAKGFLAYQEICQFVQNEGWTKVSDPEKKMGPYAYKGNQWVGYDDPAMAEYKAEYIIENNLGGAMFWDLPSDDFSNRCGHGKYPIIQAVADTLACK